MSNFLQRYKSVHVRSYVRTRFGNLETVCTHWRSLPGQMNLFD
ncbi:MAG: hypothetical protein JWR60_1633 [Polaromonas sp.]|nr:hypothetical protein [Polaromonas sp.]